MNTLQEARKHQYQYNIGLHPHLNDWRKNPYTFLKARFYMEAGAALVWLLLKTKIKPNTVTVIGGLSSLLGGILLTFPSKVAHLLAILIFFTRGVLDWSDGHLARVTRQTSFTGYILDVYGALLNELGFQMGLGFYVAFRTGNLAFVYCIPAIPFFYAAQLKGFSERVILWEILKKDVFKDWLPRYADSEISGGIANDVKNKVLGQYKKVYDFLAGCLDGRARNVDLVCFLILVEVFTDISVTWVVFVAFLIKGFLFFVGGYYILLKNNFAEKLIDATINRISDSPTDPR